jgi:hypothetical protein
MRTVRTEFVNHAWWYPNTRHTRCHDGAHARMATVPIVFPDLDHRPRQWVLRPTDPGPRPCRADKGTHLTPLTPTGGGTCVEGRVPQVLGLLLYHISRHVVGTFKACHSTTTPFDLNIFILYRRGINQPWISHKAPPVDLMIPTKFKASNKPISREWQEITRLLPNPY